jgi:hypothetical protein
LNKQFQANGRVNERILSFFCQPHPELFSLCGDFLPFYRSSISPTVLFSVVFAHLASHVLDLLAGILGAAASVFGGMDASSSSQQQQLPQQQQQASSSTSKAHHHHHSHHGSN